MSSARTRSANTPPIVRPMYRWIASQAPRTLEERPTSAARYALRYWEDLLAKTATGRTLGPLAEALWSERRIAVDAPELATVAAWQAATPKRQKQIAADVAAALTKHVGTRCKVVDLASFGGPPIAILAIGRQQFCLVPGGTVEMGMSEEEEAAIRAHGNFMEFAPLTLLMIYLASDFYGFQVIAGLSVVLLVARLVGFSRAALPLVIAFNWLSVPLQWAYVPVSLIQIWARGDTAALRCAAFARLR